MCSTGVGVVVGREEREGGGGERDVGSSCSLPDGCDFRGFVAYAAIDCGGGIGLSRLQSHFERWYSGGRWPTPMPRRQFARYLCDYLRHSFLRPINFNLVGFLEQAAEELTTARTRGPAGP